MGCDGTSQVNLTNQPADDKQPSWATGGRLAFSSNRNAEGKFDIYLLTLSPWGVTRLTTNEANDESPALSPDGSKVAFVSYRDDDGDAEIYVMTIPEGNLVKITSNSSADMDPAWSPDGSRIAFASKRDGDWDIFSVNADGSGIAKDTDVSSSGSNERWPDLGDYSGDEVIAFASNRDGDWEIFTYDPYSGLIQATANIDNTIDAMPSWGPPGDEMVYHSDRDVDSNFNVFRALYDGAAYENLSPETANSSETSPDWEPVDDGAYCGE